MRETIFARSTGALPAAIAIVRVSGPRAAAALETLSGRPLPEPRKAVVRVLCDAQGALLDRAMVLWLPGPDTATGEDLVELHLHGGRAVVGAVEAALAGLPGLMPAAAGAFTRRAFENGRIDLTQVEGLADLLAAETQRQRIAALAVAEGGLRRRVGEWQAQVLGLAARAEAAIDFADEHDVVPDAALTSAIAQLGAALRTALDEPPAERLRDGVRIAIAGPPNSGKSTLLNALIERDAAIASPIAGTTRDLVEAPVILDGLPLVFVDMAGLRETPGDAVEAIGIERARGAIARSDLVLWLGDVDATPGGEVIHVTTKTDLGVADPRADVAVSAVTGAGMRDLRARLVGAASRLVPATGSVALSTGQRALIAEAANALDTAAAQSDEVLRAEALRSALRAFDRVTGVADTEAMLDALFGRFCIGK